MYQFEGYEVSPTGASGDAANAASAQPFSAGDVVIIGDLVAAFNGPVLFQSTATAPRGSMRPLPND
jgi:hypothetical protein